MTIKSKLFISYAILLVIFIIVSSISFFSIEKWNETADSLKTIQMKSTLVENLRSMMYQQINLGRDYINDDSMPENRIVEIGLQVDLKIKEFENITTLEEEKNHYEALAETFVELEWILNGIIIQKENSETEFNKNTARLRLSEIVDEVSDDIFIFNKYYQDQRASSIASSKRAGEKAVFFIASSVAVVLVLLIILLVFNQRWLLRPIESVNQVT